MEAHPGERRYRKMVYEICIKTSEGCCTPIHTHDMEVARAIIKERFFNSMNINEAIDVAMDAVETDKEKTGMIMQYRVKTKKESSVGTVTAIPDEDFFTEEWASEFEFPKSFTVNFI
jgi:hypothetical protein